MEHAIKRADRDLPCRRCTAVVMRRISPWAWHSHGRFLASLLPPSSIFSPPLRPPSVSYDAHRSLLLYPPTHAHTRTHAMPRPAAPMMILHMLCALALAGTLARAFTTDQFPYCALLCATNAAEVVKCKQTNTTCLCASPAFAQSVVTCTSMGGGCAPVDQPAVLAELAAICPDLPAPTLPTTAAHLASSPSSTSTPSSPTADKTATTTAVAATAVAAQASSVVSGAARLAVTPGAAVLLVNAVLLLRGA
ncbi:hypothetical protein HYPSUDRAFT_293818 [Hypholoma sublateritium FD-334 SS-4]|uniref:CFEM domain-containing protein n=1 Tax=Hypholoma sublateritium (strain FD-334 SS-4) TaxID=945553 RepID=A0A0D2P7N3_HYPSF|nr:hypothetical protein HYPSUDRAFT_293818 [Hypholoma sublateritium FD-334 SS-4]